MSKLNPDMVRWVFIVLMIIMFIVTGIAGADWQYSLTGAIGFTWIIFEMMMLHHIGRTIHGMLAYLMRPATQPKVKLPQQSQSPRDIMAEDTTKKLRAQIFPIDEGKK